MGNQKVKWTADEGAALLAGIQKHGLGKWTNILKDPEFAAALVKRSNIDLKDKWRNIAVSANGTVMKDIPRSSKSNSMVPLALPSKVKDPHSTPKPESAPAHLITPTQNVIADAIVDDGLSQSPEAKIGHEYTAMIFDALKALNNPEGSDIGMIVSYIESRYEAPQNLKRSFGSKLRMLAAQGKLNKIGNRYSIKTDPVVGPKSTSLKYKWDRPQQMSSSKSPKWLELITDASEAARLIAVAEGKSHLAEEAVKEADRVSEVAAKSESVLEMVKDIYSRCLRGEAVYME